MGIKMPVKYSHINSMCVDETRQFAYEIRYIVKDLIEYKKQLQCRGVSFSFEIRLINNVLYFKYPASLREGKAKLIEAIEGIEKEVKRVMDDKNLIHMFNTKGD